MAKQKKTSRKAKKVGSTTSKTPDAETLLKQDHRNVEELFEQYKAASDEDEKRTLAHEICNELIVHTMIEEEIFYPACRERGVNDDKLDEAQVEHDGAKVMINDLLMEDADAPFYDAKVLVLSEYIKHHVREEEKADGIFAKARQAGVDMSGLKQRLEARKQELEEQAEAERLGRPRFRALGPQARFSSGQYERERGEYRRRAGEDVGGRGQQYRYEGNGDRDRRGQGGWFGENDRGAGTSRRRFEERRHEYETQPRRRDHQEGFGNHRYDVDEGREWRGRDDDQRHGTRGRSEHREGRSGRPRGEQTWRGREDH